MKTRLLPALAVLLLALLAPVAATAGQAGLLDLEIVEAQTSSTQIAVQWSQPQGSAGFLRYELMRGSFIPVSALSAAGLGALLLGLMVAGWALRKRRGALAASALAVSLSLTVGFQAWAAIGYELRHTEPVFANTSFPDTQVVAGEGYFYKVVAHFQGGPQQESPVRFGRAVGAVPIADSGLIVRFEQGPGPILTPEDGAILPRGTASVPVSGCIAETSAGCAGVPVRGGITGDLYANQGKISLSNIDGSFTQAVNLQEGPNFVHMTGLNSSGKTVTLARSYSIGELQLAGALIENAIGVVVSPKPLTGKSLLKKLEDQINAQTAADWNELLDKLDFPRVVHIQNDSATVDVTIRGVDMDGSGDIIANTLELAGATTAGAVFNVDVVIDGLNVNYGDFEASFNLEVPPFQVVGNTCPRNGPSGRIRIGRMRGRATIRLEIQSGKLYLELLNFNGAKVLLDEAAGTGDAFDSGRTIGGPLCIVSSDLDANLVEAVSSQAESIFAHYELGSTSIDDVALGETGLTLDLKLAEMSQDSEAAGLVIRLDAGIDSPGPVQVSFPMTDNPPPDSRTVTGGSFPGNFNSALDAGFTISDDLLNEGIAASQAVGLLTGALEGELKIGATTVPLTVAGLDPAPHAADAYLPNLHVHAPPEAKVRIAISNTSNPLVAVRAGALRGQGGLDVLQTGLVADVLVDTDRDGIFDAASEKALTLDLDVLASTDVSLVGGAVQFSFVSPVRGYTATPGFLDVPHAALKGLAEAIIEDRITRLLGVLNGIGGAGLVIPGLSFQTLDSIADGGTTAAYKDNLSAWGASEIDLKELIEAILDRLDPPAP